MAQITRGSSDNYVLKIKTALDEFEREHPGAAAMLYRHSPASIRIRIVDKGFAGMSKGDRHDLVWNFLSSRLEKDVLEEIAILLSLSPKEQSTSFMNAEFEDPIPSAI